MDFFFFFPSFFPPYKTFCVGLFPFLMVTKSLGPFWEKEEKGCKKEEEQREM